MDRELEKMHGDLIDLKYDRHDRDADINLYNIIERLIWRVDDLVEEINDKL